MNKKLFMIDLILLMFEVLLLIMINFAFPQYNNIKPVEYIVTAFSFAVASILTLLFFKNVKNTYVTLNDAINSYALAAVSIIFFLIINSQALSSGNPTTMFIGTQGTVFIGLTMTFGVHGSYSLSQYFLNNSKDYGYGNNSKANSHMSGIYERLSTLSIVVTIFILFLKVMFMY